ncbi:MAG: PilW family protein [Thiomonas sp.]|uniref:PilW family protein n=1 Tax=Thiomonas sp. TaxID=2047785 RepID=UPI002A36CE6E|nr:PilW family protein [Thiomonas sp.]MDY0331221.1 PilW family protein [Thiomonas sp.]
MNARPFKQRGLGLVEVLVGLAIALFLLSGLAAIFAAMLQSSQTRNALSDLQQRQLLAATILSKTLQQSGYYPNPTASTAADMLPASTTSAPSPFGSAAQGLVATASSVTNRFVAPANDVTDSVINCQGGSNTTNAPVTYTNAFSVDTDQDELQCSLDGAAAQPIVDGVTSMHLLYGVDTLLGAASDAKSVNRYVPADNVAANGGWNAVKNLRITLCFANPLKKNQPAPAVAPCAADELPFTFFVNLIGQGQT